MHVHGMPCHRPAPRLSPAGVVVCPLLDGPRALSCCLGWLWHMRGMLCTQTAGKGVPETSLAERQAGGARALPGAQTCWGRTSPWRALRSACASAQKVCGALPALPDLAPSLRAGAFGGAAQGGLCVMAARAVGRACRCGFNRDEAQNTPSTAWPAVRALFLAC